MGLLKEVAPEDILILAGKSTSFDLLEQQLGEIPTRLVGGRSRATQDEPLIQTGMLTISTIASAKGYDAPIVLLIDTDDLPASTAGRALFYVGATRARRYLVVTGVKSAGSLLDEAVSVSSLLKSPEF
jgi:superfamily I DNA/RNA helicase